MNIYNALKTITPKRKEYFLWKFNLNFRQGNERKSEEEFLKVVGNKTLDGFLAWEKSEEYRNLVAILLNTRFDQDLEEIYSSLSNKAKTGDEKSIRLLLQMGKEIKEYSKQAVRQMTVKSENDKNNDDGLIV